MRTDVYYTWNKKALTVGENRFLEQMYGLHGSFFSAFYDALMKADVVNKAKLFAGFPDEVLTYQRVMEDGDYWYDILKRSELKANDVPVPIDQPNGTWWMYILPPAIKLEKET